MTKTGICFVSNIPYSIHLVRCFRFSCFSIFGILQYSCAVSAPLSALVVNEPHFSPSD